MSEQHIHVHVYTADVDALAQAVSRIEAKLNQQETSMAQGIGTVVEELTNLQAKVAKGNTLVQSTRDMIAGLRDQLHANATDPAAIRAIADNLVAQQDAWAQALVDNTSAAGEPPSGEPMVTDASKAGQPADLSKP